MRASILDNHRREIIDMLDMGVPKTRIAKACNVNPSTLHYWLNTRGARGFTHNHALADTATQIIENVTNGTRDDLYARLSRALEGLEHECVWLGNGHHAAQRITRKVMTRLEPLLANQIRREVLR